ncbi:MAG TPA: glycoside hydrolase family 27 protein [Bacillota bacterium]|nr:glycoside hydrolase family 27 protein [Bacillota bacterium]
MIAKTPPMGWNTWNTFGWDINESLVKEAADAFIETGLKSAGYEYIVIDDCWSKKERDKDNKLVADEAKFPSGMNELSEYIHNKGLKFGIYSCAGVQTCAGYPGSFEHEFIDAKTFASWGVDFLKYDYCYKPDGVPGHLLYKRMSMALKNSGRNILFSACNWGDDEVEKWIRASGAHMWRSTGDIQDNWVSIKDIALSQIGKECYSGPYCFNDVDMLVVGMYGEGNVALGGCSDEEYKTHFSLWCLMNSPLMIGCDIRNMSQSTQNILTNKEIIDINQDVEGRQAYTIRHWNDLDMLIYIKPLNDGSYAFGFFNMSDDEREAALHFWDAGLPSSTGYGFSLRDVWTHEDIGIYKEGYKANLKAHACQVLRARLVKI